MLVKLIKKCKKNLVALTGWMLLPFTLRLHLAPRTPSTENSYFRGQIVCLASHRDAFHRAVCLRGRIKKLEHATIAGTCVHRMSSEILMILLYCELMDFLVP